MGDVIDLQTRRPLETFQPPKDMIERKTHLLVRATRALGKSTLLEPRIETVDYPCPGPRCPVCALRRHLVGPVEAPLGEPKAADPTPAFEGAGALTLNERKALREAHAKASPRSQSRAEMLALLNHRRHR